MSAKDPSEIIYFNAQDASAVFSFVTSICLTGIAFVEEEWAGESFFLVGVVFHLIGVFVHFILSTELLFLTGLNYFSGMAFIQFQRLFGASLVIFMGRRIENVLPNSMDAVKKAIRFVTTAIFAISSSGNAMLFGTFLKQGESVSKEIPQYFDETEYATVMGNSLYRIQFPVRVMLEVAFLAIAISKVIKFSKLGLTKYIKDRQYVTFAVVLTAIGVVFKVLACIATFTPNADLGLLQNIVDIDSSLTFYSLLKLGYDLDERVSDSILHSKQGSKGSSKAVVSQTSSKAMRADGE
jgi:hypothetical protein